MTRKIILHTTCNGSVGRIYAPWAGEDGGAQFDRNANKSDYVTVGANFKQKMGGMSVGVSAGLVQ